MLRISMVFFLFLLYLPLKSQIIPKEGSKLNYRIIGFSFPKGDRAGEYKIEIAAGNFSSVADFQKNIIQTVACESNKVIAEVPSFGAQYTWRPVYYRKKKFISYGELNHFNTKANDRADTLKLRMRIIQPASSEYKDNYVFTDGGGVLYDFSGHPVWFLPDTDGISGYVADLKATPEGTITFISKDAYEIDYNARQLWKASNKGTISGDTVHGEFFHHEFSRLSNGHYMLLGMQRIFAKLITLKDSSYIDFTMDRSSEARGYKLARLGTLLEYDKSGNLVWSWVFSKNLEMSDFKYFENIKDTAKRWDPHDNAFYFDEPNKCIYLGFRNLSRIMKIEYPSGKTLGFYGENFFPGNSVSTGNNLLCNQHTIARSKDGNLYIFNNNSCMFKDSLPTIVEVKEPQFPGDTFKKVWEYTCTMEGNYNKFFGSGGNATELADGSFFVNMGSEYNKQFIVTRDKKIAWSAIAERFMESDQKWTPIHEYRTSILSRKELERLIWNSEK